VTLAPQATLTRVLVVDDSVVVRRVVTRALAGAPGVEVVGAARDGRVAVAKVDSLRPDVVILDLEMPEMDGLQALAEIRRGHPELPVIVYSHLTTQAASATFDALALGATHFALKPSANGIGLAEESVRSELLPLIRGLAASSRRRPTVEPPHSPARPGHEVSAVVIAVSTGGPDSLAAVIRALPGHLEVPILIVQHMPPIFTRILAERLDRGSAIPVAEAAHGEEVIAGRVYIAAGGRHMALTRTRGAVVVELNDGPPENSCRPAADVLFRTAADVYGAGLLAVVMTGMGQDGLSGARAVRAAGGTVIAQSEASSVIASMPRAVAEAGMADAIVPLGDLATVLARRVSVGR
jgi:two-component system, chemotaxis family, protein-glutamate methylesterase/glutaminase